jgi:hypothetical protein
MDYPELDVEQTYTWAERRIAFFNERPVVRMRAGIDLNGVSFDILKRRAIELVARRHVEWKTEVTVLRQAKRAQKPGDVRLEGEKLSSSSFMNCVRKVGWRTQS